MTVLIGPEVFLHRLGGWWPLPWGEPLGGGIVIYFIAFAAAAALSFLLAYPIRSIALSLEVVDRPEKRKMHQIPIPLMGGAAIFLSFAIVSVVQVLFFDSLAESYARPYIGLMAGALVIVGLGLYDDAKGLKAPAKFAGQILAAIAVVSSGLTVDLFTNPLGDQFRIGWLGIPVTIFWIVGVTNAINLIDGLDGLAAGVGGIAALGLFAVAVPGNPFMASMTIILAGACFGMLRHNFYPARLFLGDTGSMFIGFTLAVVGLHGSYKATAATALVLPIVVLGVPIFDTMIAIVRRAKRRVSPFKADRQHIHHRLVRIGLHHRSVVLVLYFMAAYLALTAYSIAHIPYQTAFLFLVLLTVGGVIALRTLQFIEERFEAGIEAAGLGTNGRVREGRPASPAVIPRGFSTMVCEVGAFRPDFGERGDREIICEDIRAMLSRRVRVHAVMAEPSAPGHMMVLVRTEPLSPSLEALVQDGLAWYMEDHRERFSDDAAFPRIQWIRPAPVTRQGPDAAAARAEAWPVPRRDGRATALGS